LIHGNITQTRDIDVLNRYSVISFFSRAIPSEAHPCLIVYFISHTGCGGYIETHKVGNGYHSTEANAAAGLVPGYQFEYIPSGR
jgi:hypothetical protein